MSDIEFTSAIPVLPTGDMPAAIASYREKLGFELWFEMDRSAIVMRGAAEFHLNGFAEFPAGGPPTLARVNLRAQSGGVDALYAAVDPSIVLPDEKLATQPHGMRQFGILDPSGNRITFAEPVAGIAGQHVSSSACQPREGSGCRIWLTAVELALMMA
jgi:catechol 2,3-dioxygenase-like lactoylglutathione lyase family enzyme